MLPLGNPALENCSVPVVLHRWTSCVRVENGAFSGVFLHSDVVLTSSPVANRILSRISAMLTFAMEQDWIESNQSTEAAILARGSLRVDTCQ